jgi:hypothetical protein
METEHGKASKALQAGDAFFNEERVGIPRHLWIVVSDPAQDEDQILIANVTSRKSVADSDNSCILNKGCHPHIPHESIINYRGACLTALVQLCRGIDKGLLKMTQPVDDDVLEKVRSGFMVSPFSKNGHKELLCKQGLVS